MSNFPYSLRNLKLTVRSRPQKGYPRLVAGEEARQRERQGASSGYWREKRRAPERIVAPFGGCLSERAHGTNGINWVGDRLDSWLCCRPDVDSMLHPEHLQRQGGENDSLRFVQWLRSCSFSRCNGWLEPSCLWFCRGRSWLTG